MAKKAVKSRGGDRKDKLAALREKLENTNYGGGSQGFWSPKAGMNTIRILPEVGDMEFFYQPVGKHFLPNKTQVYCPHFTSEGELECPVCKVQSDLWNAGDEASRSLAGQLRVKKGFWMNVIVRTKEGTDQGPFIYTPGITVFEAITVMVSDPDYGDIFDEEEGLDLTIKRTGEKLDTRYDVLAKRNSSPLMDDDAEIDRVMDEAKDLSWVEVSDDPEEDKKLSEGHAIFLLPYDRLVRELGLDSGLGGITQAATEPEDEDDDVDNDDEPEEDEVVQEVRRRRARRAR